MMTRKRIAKTYYDLSPSLSPVGTTKKKEITLTEILEWYYTLQTTTKNIDNGQILSREGKHKNEKI